MELSDCFRREGDGDRDTVLGPAVYSHLGESGKVSFTKKPVVPPHASQTSSLWQTVPAQRLCSVEEREFLFKRTHNQMLLRKDDSSLPRPSNQAVLQGSMGSTKGPWF